MIKNLFLPTRVGHTYLFPQRIVAFDLSHESVRATLVYAHRSLSTISACIEESFNPAKPGSLVEALQKIQTSLGKWDKCIVALPSSKVIFKQLRLPFINKAKIRLVLPFELEATLPFPVEEAVLDVLITSVDKEAHESDVFVAAMRRSALDIYVQPFLEAGFFIDRVTLGSLELYGFLKLSREPKVNEGFVLALDLDTTTTDVLFMAGGVLRSIRTLMHGISPQLSRLDTGTISDDQRKGLLALVSEVRFTIQAAMRNEKVVLPPSHILLAGSGSQMAGLAAFFSENLGIPCSIVYPHSIVRHDGIDTNLHGMIAAQNVKSLAAALPWTIVEDFNVGRALREEHDVRFFKIQIIATMVIVGLFFASVFLIGFLNIRQLGRELDQSKQEVIQKLSKEFGITLHASKKGPAVTTLVNDARQKLISNESLWSALTDDRYSFLRYLQELSTHINRQEIGLDLKRLSIKRDEQSGEDKLTLDGSVRNYDALRKFEEALIDTKLFKSVRRLEEVKFTLPLIIDKEGGAR
ncbi:TPA: hypothetical protein DDZ86_00810 [Candidatus Dependentiae bacterium]|nr:MAG: hypothetical protein UW09_C0004G0044 [candidate division TM6 bacterium GW2011_GWF2_43_87]HBL98165.1 hypothetical protein [Candidatus Dependentiae bacterium]